MVLLIKTVEIVKPEIGHANAFQYLAQMSIMEYCKQRLKCKYNKINTQLAIDST